MFESVLRRGGSFLKRVGTGLLRTVEFYNDLEIDRDEHESFSTEAVYVGLDDDVDEPARTNLEVYEDSPAAEASPVESQECRICRDVSNAATDPLISPCNCTGSVQFVHQSCLDSWRAVPRPCGRARDSCEVCHAPYKVPSAKELQEQQTTALERIIDAVEGFILAAMPEPAKTVSWFALLGALLASAYICQLLKTACVKIRERYNRLLAFVARCASGRL